MKNTEITSKKHEIIPSGNGLFGFAYCAATIHRTNAGNIRITADRWCGSGVEGRCYRKHAASLTEEQAELLMSAARGELNGSAPEVLHDMPIAWIRIGK